MIYRLSHLLSLTATPRDGEFPVSELFYDPATWKLRYVALGAGGWFDLRELLIGIEHFGTPEDGRWPLDLSREDVEDAPQWDEAPSAATYMPPIIIGPFGNTFSPLLLAAQWLDAEGNPPEDPRREPSGEVPERVFRMGHARHWIGREVRGPDGPLGTVSDINLSPDWVLNDIVLEDGTVIPLARLDHVAEEGHAVLA